MNKYKVNPSFASSIEELEAKLKAENANRAVIVRVIGGIKSNERRADGTLIEKVQLQVAGFVKGNNGDNLLADLNTESASFGGNKARFTWLTAGIKDAAALTGLSIEQLQSLPKEGVDKKALKEGEYIDLYATVESNSGIMKLIKLQTTTPTTPNERNLLRIPARNGKPEVRFFDPVNGAPVYQTLGVTFVPANQDVSHQVIPGLVRRAVEDTAVAFAQPAATQGAVSMETPAAEAMTESLGGTATT